MGNTRWYKIMDKAYGVDWEMAEGFKWLNMNRWYGLTNEEVQEVITRYEDNQSLLPLTEMQVRYVVDRYGLKQVAERVEQELVNRASILSFRGNGKNSDIIMDEDGEIVGFVFDGKTYM